MNDFPDFRERISGQDVYFILGSQGSGTNLVSRFLRRLFNFSVVHDRSLIINTAVDLLKATSAEQFHKQAWKVYRRLFPGPLRKRLVSKHYHHQSKNYLGIERFLSEVDIDSPEKFAHFFYAYHAFRTNGKHLAVKSDDIWERIGSIGKVIPRRKFLHLVRDPRDNALSIINKDFGPRDIYSAAWYVKKRLQTYSRAVNDSPQDSLIVHYERLLTEPFRFVEEFQQCFGMEPVDNLQQAIADLKIRSTNFEKWRSLPRKSLEICESILAEDLAHFGYELSTRPKSSIAWHVAAISRTRDVLLRIPQRIRTRAGMIIRP